jgi:hypothetical protein
LVGWQGISQLEELDVKQRRVSLRYSLCGPLLLPLIASYYERFLGLGMVIHICNPSNAACGSQRQAMRLSGKKKKAK